ncbi:MAG: ABC transporter permease [Thermoproteota archaeon]
MIDTITSILSSSFPLMAPILIAGLGELIAERAGVINLGVEGIMSASSLIALVVTYFSGDYALGFLSGIGVGAVFGLAYAFIVVTIAVNQLIAGLLFFIFGQNIASFIYRLVIKYQVPSVNPLPNVEIPVVKELPIIGRAFFSQPLYVYVSLFLVFIIRVVLHKTSWGLAIRSAGENPEAVAAAGINVNLLRFICVVVGSMFAGFAGAVISVGYIGLYQTGLIAGRGWLAIIAVIVAGWNPINLLLSSWVLGLGFSTAASLLTLRGGIAQYYFYLTLPYVFSLFVVLLIPGRRRGPAALTVPYKRR